MSWMLPAALYCMLAILWETVDQMCLSPAQHLWKVQNQQQQFELPYYSKPITSFILFHFTVFEGTNISAPPIFMVTRGVLIASPWGFVPSATTSGTSKKSLGSLMKPWNPQGNPWKSGVGISGIRMIQGNMMLPNLGSCRFTQVLLFFFGSHTYTRWRLEVTQECLDNFLGKTHKKGVHAQQLQQLWPGALISHKLWRNPLVINLGNTKYSKSPNLVYL